MIAMHEFRRFIEDLMALNDDMKPAGLARASGLSPQHISQILNDDRDVMKQMPEDKTIDGIAAAFPGVTKTMVRTAAVRALGVPAADTPAMVLDLHDISVDMLLGEIRRRIEGNQNAASQEPRTEARGTSEQSTPPIAAQAEAERARINAELGVDVTTPVANDQHRELSDGDGTTTKRKGAAKRGA